MSNVKEITFSFFSPFNGKDSFYWGTFYCSLGEGNMDTIILDNASSFYYGNGGYY